MDLGHEDRDDGPSAAHAVRVTEPQWISVTRTETTTTATVPPGGVETPQWISVTRTETTVLHRPRVRCDGVAAMDLGHEDRDDALECSPVRGIPRAAMDLGHEDRDDARRRVGCGRLGRRRNGSRSRGPRRRLLREGPCDLRERGCSRGVLAVSCSRSAVQLSRCAFVQFRGWRALTRGAWLAGGLAHTIVGPAWGI